MPATPVAGGVAVVFGCVVGAAGVVGVGPAVSTVVCASGVSCWPW